MPVNPASPGAPADEHATPLTYEEEQQLLPAFVTTRDQLNDLEQLARCAASGSPPNASSPRHGC